MSRRREPDVFFAPEGGRAVALFHPVAQVYVTPDAGRPYRPDDPLVRAHRWAFAELDGDGSLEVPAGSSIDAAMSAERIAISERADRRAAAQQRRVEAREAAARKRAEFAERARQAAAKLRRTRADEES